MTDPAKAPGVPTEPAPFNGGNQLPVALAPSSLPAFMQNKPVEGLEVLSKFQSYQRIIIVQPQAKSDKKAMFGGEGVVGMVPMNKPLALKGVEFIAIPLMFFPSWESWRDNNDKSGPNGSPVIESTFDEVSDLAKKCKARLSEQYPNPADPTRPFNRRYLEILNFIVAIDDGEFKGEIAMMSFMSGEHRNGANLCGTIRRRPGSIYANRFTFKTSLRKRPKGEWYGFDTNNPTPEQGGPFVSDEKTFDQLKELHHSLKAAMANGKFNIERGGEDAEAEADGGGSNAGGDLPPL